MGEFFISLIKVLCFFILLPVIFATATTLQNHLAKLPDLDLENFLLGAYVLIMIFLFFYQFWGVYEFGHSLTNNLFKFLAPFDRLVSNIFSFYVLLIMVLFYVTNRLLDVISYNFLFMFLLGFFMTMHILLVAQDLQEQEKTLIKPNYLFNIPLVVICNIFMLVLFFDLLLGRWSFPQYFSDMSWETKETFKLSFKTIFLLE